MAAVIAVQVAQAQQQRLMQEEEQMTPYPPDDLNTGWEFKIVRSLTGTFRNPDKFRKLVEEEKRAGWVLLEKFDDKRVRFKRPPTARSQDDQLLQQGIDPYRTQYGMSQGVYTALVLGVVFAITLAIVVCIALLSAQPQPL